MQQLHAMFSSYCIFLLIFNHSTQQLNIICVFFQTLQSRCLTTAELADPNFSVEIAEKLARFHLLDLPLCKVPKWLNNVLDK